jgi:hypothetical protein
MSGSEVTESDGREAAAIDGITNIQFQNDLLLIVEFLISSNDKHATDIFVLAPV